SCRSSRRTPTCASTTPGARTAARFTSAWEKRSDEKPSPVDPSGQLRFQGRGLGEGESRGAAVGPLSFRAPRRARGAPSSPLKGRGKEGQKPASRKIDGPQNL